MNHQCKRVHSICLPHLPDKAGKSKQIWGRFVGPIEGFLSIQALLEERQGAAESDIGPPTPYRL